MTPKTRKKIQEGIKKLVESRNKAMKLGEVWAVQEINKMLMKLAKHYSEIDNLIKTYDQQKKEN